MIKTFIALSTLALAVAALHPSPGALAPLLGLLTVENAHKLDEALTVLKLCFVSTASLAAVIVFACGLILHELKTFLRLVRQFRRVAEGGKTPPPGSATAVLKQSPGELSPPPAEGPASHS
jgi:hypothetical protein